MSTPTLRSVESDSNRTSGRSTMRAIVIHEHGGPNVLTYEPKWPRPVAEAGEILVHVRACALNFLDIFARQGMPGEPTPLPQITGGDIAGVVAETASDVTTPVLGDRVVLNPSWGCGVCEYCGIGETPRCLRPHMLGEIEAGGLAEYVKCPARQAIRLPADYAFEDAASLPIAFGTAWRMIVRFAHIVPDETVLVLGAGGGVAIAAIQIAKLMGARIIAAASSDEKLARVRSLGADEVINYSRDEDWDTIVRHLTSKRGADVVIETIGEATWQRSVRALGKGGRLITCGATSGPIGATDVRYLFRREQTIQGSNGWTHDELLHVTSLAFRRKLRPVIDRVLPLARTAEGELALERREVFGKVIIDPTRADAA